MRPIDELIIHCTATPEGREVTRTEIDQWHRARGWRMIGYHKVVHLDGSVSEGRPESEIGAHVAGHNSRTIGYVYVGGVDRQGRPKDTRTKAQKQTLLRLAREAVERYGLRKVSGHREYAAKACPSFDAKKEYAHLISNPDERVPTADKTVRRGDRGPEVKAWQDMLRHAGIDLKADGIFGQKTEYATRLFQKKWGLMNDGIVGPQTKAEMTSVLARIGDKAPQKGATARKAKKAPKDENKPKTPDKPDMGRLEAFWRWLNRMTGGL